MTAIKEHLKSIVRTGLIDKSREGYLRLDMNENPSGLPAWFLKKALSELSPVYVASYPEYRTIQEKIAGHNNIQPENICLSNGSDAAIKYLFDAYISPGDSVLITDPTFAMYPVYCKMFNVKSVTVGYDSSLSFPVGEFIERINDAVKMAVVVNPNNPTGSVLEHDELLRIIKKTKRENILLVIDEAYFYFYPETFIEYIREYDNLIVLRTFSKLCGMASVRLGYAAACNEIITNLNKVKPTFDVNGLAVFLAERIIDNVDLLKSMIKNIDEGKKYLIRMLQENNIRYIAGNANFILIECKGKVDKVINRLAERKILVSGRFKQHFLMDYIRVTVGERMCMEVFWESFSNIWKNMD